MHNEIPRHLRKSTFEPLGENPILGLEAITHYYGDNLALESIDCQVYKGKILFVTGESGAGKTSLLNIITGKLKPTSGRRTFADPNLKITWMSQQLEIVEEFSVFDNLSIAYQDKVHGSFRQFENEALELSKFLGVFDRLELKAKKANGGLRQILVIMRSLLSRPELLILDEPTKSLDEKNAIKAFELMEYYCEKKGMSIVWASHNRSLIKKFSGNMIHLERGKIVYSGQACFI